MNMKLDVLIRSIFTYSGIIFVGVICFLPCFFIALLPMRYRYNSRIYYWFSDVFFKSIITFSCLPVEIKGKQNLPGNTPVIFAGNHQSAFDIPVLGSLGNGYPQIWLVLSDYLYAPLLGFFVRRMNIPVYQESIAKSAAALKEAILYIKNQQRDLVIFPEGRRIREGTISNFMRGFATIARSTRRPIVPVYMPNNGKIYPPHSFLIYYYPLKIIIGEPFHYQENDTEELFSKRVHQWFVDQSLKEKKS